MRSSYEMDYKFWEVVLVIRRFGVALITVTIDEPMIQAAATIILLTILIAAHGTCAVMHHACSALVLLQSARSQRSEASRVPQNGQEGVLACA